METVWVEIKSYYVNDDCYSLKFSPPQIFMFYGVILTDVDINKMSH